MTHPASALPNIDLGAIFKVIDDSGPTPRWRTLERGWATQKMAQSVIKKHRVTGVWMFDDCGYKTYISRNDERSTTP